MVKRFWVLARTGLTVRFFSYSLLRIFTITIMRYPPPRLVKKRLKEASKQEDLKVAKKARKLAEDTIGQKNTMLKHLSNVPTAPKPSTRGPTSKQY